MPPKLTLKAFSQLWLAAMDQLALSRKQAAEFAGSYSTADRYTKGITMPKPGGRRQLERALGLPMNYFEGTVAADWNLLRAKQESGVVSGKKSVAPEAAARLIGEVLSSYERLGITQVSIGQAREWLALAGIDLPKESGGDDEPAGGKGKSSAGG